MPGLLNSQMQPPQGMPPEQAAPQGAPPPTTPPDQIPPDEGMGEPDENHPAFQAAIQMGNTALYQEGAADNIHKQLLATDDPVNEMANIAYEITAIMDERTEGQVPDELLILLGTVMLNEVADIAIASGIELMPADLANAMKTMILRYVGEMGHDTQELQAAMDAIPPEQFNQMAGDMVAEPQGGM
ncbi:hypothetical protein [Vreelandella stevensii]|uniref:hypothetical protein n=1 Tax=Vreelandella stevensii TaxID=502821 RepID=UPI00403A80B5